MAIFLCPISMFLASLLIPFEVLAAEPDSSRVVQLQGVEVVSFKENGRLRQQPSSVTLITHSQMEEAHITSLKAASARVPNLFIPDYGSRLTSAIYIRGIGSRINTPAVGLYVDNVPYIDKSAFDFNFYDIESIDILRGPQGTLYGRNTMGGLVRVHTKNPFHYQGTDLKLGYATGDNHRSIALTHYHRPADSFAFSAGGYYEGGDGFFKNDFTDKSVDDIQGGGGRIRAIWLPADAWTLDLSLSYDYSDEGAYPYYYIGSATQTELYPELIDKITNNRKHNYRRGVFNVGMNLEYRADLWQMNAITGYQYLNDRLLLDQDFMSFDNYTLEQRQRIHTLTEEITFKNLNAERWEWVTGVNLMVQGLRTTGPVTFYGDGLRWLEGNINTVMPTIDRIPMLQMMGFTGMLVNFRGDDLLMDGTYETPSFGAALFHQSTYHFGEHLSAILGLRLDYEHQQMDYHSPADVNYGFRMPNSSNEKMAVDLQDLTSHILYDGVLKDDHFRVLPKFALKYEMDADNNVYTSLSMGQRSGGYNLQMFSDLLQGALRVDMMDGIKEGVGGYLDYLAETNPVMPKYIPDPDSPGEMVYLPDFVRRVMSQNMPQFEIPSTRQVVYRPEYSWNFELGTHLTLLDYKLSLDAAVFYNRIYDQQISRFAPSGLGRMMVNAGKSQSCGGELAMRFCPNRHLTFSGNYGYTHSSFLDYDAGDGHDYTDNLVPFVPAHTFLVDAAYTWFFGENNLMKSIALGANYAGTGRIYWTEDNRVSQPFYAQLGARLGLSFEHLNVQIWGKNLTDDKSNTFYFESASRCYEQHCKPLQVGVDLNFYF